MSTHLSYVPVVQWEVEANEATHVLALQHGVSYLVVKMAFLRCGLPNFESVKEQEEPDADFPTVAFPNPEEKGLLLPFRIVER